MLPAAWPPISPHHSFICTSATHVQFDPPRSRAPPNPSEASAAYHHRSITAEVCFFFSSLSPSLVTTAVTIAAERRNARPRLSPESTTSFHPTILFHQAATQGLGREAFCTSPDRSRIPSLQLPSSSPQLHIRARPHNHRLKEPLRLHPLSRAPRGVRLSAALPTNLRLTTTSAQS